MRMLRLPTSIMGHSSIIGISAMMILVCWLVTITQLEQSRTRILDQSKLAADRLSSTLSYGVARVSSELDTLLLFMRAMRSARPPETEWQQIISDQYTLNNQTAQIAIMNNDGLMITSTAMLWPAKPIDLSDRAHFKVHRNTGQDKLYISEPLLGRASGKWSIQYTRPLLKDGHQFDGVIVVSLDQEKLNDLFVKSADDDTIDIGLIGHDGVVRAGTGFFKNKLGASLSDEAMMIQLQDPAFRVQENGELSLSRKYLVSIDNVDNFPLRVVVVRGAYSIAGWYSSHAGYLGLAVLVTLIIATVGMFAIDVAERDKRSQQEHRELELKSRVEDEANRLQADFLSIMSHEIRTPLNGIIGALELLNPTDSPSRNENLIGIARNSSRYLLNLIDDILVFSKSKGEPISLDERFCSLRELISGVERSWIPLFSNLKNKLFVEVSDSVPDILCFDDTKLRQVLMNLVGNAHKFTQTGTVTICVETAAYGSGKVFLCFNVKDTGIGIPEDKLAKIFDPFTSLGSDLSRRSDGVGLGLSISQSIVSAMGGKISVTSTVGVGSCFTFTLGLKIGVKAEESRREQVFDGECAIMPRRILVVEDNETNAFITSEFLATHRHQVSFANDVATTLERCSEAAFDLILMDISLPDGDGIRVTEQIRSGSTPNADTPIVALTANVDTTVLAKIKSSEMVDYLTKPVSAKKLLHFVELYAKKPSNCVAKQHEPADITPCASESLSKSGDELLDMAVFHEVFGKKSASKISRMLELFQVDLHRNRQKLTEAIKTCNQLEAQAAAHALFGGASSIGARRLAGIARRVESMSHDRTEFDWSECVAVQDTIDLTAQAIAECQRMHRRSEQSLEVV